MSGFIQFLKLEDSLGVNWANNQEQNLLCHERLHVITS